MVASMAIRWACPDMTLCSTFPDLTYIQGLFTTEVYNHLLGNLSKTFLADASQARLFLEVLLQYLVTSTCLNNFCNMNGRLCRYL